MDKENYLNRIMKPTFIKQILRARPKKVHKKQLGKILMVVGSKLMPGAGILAANASIRSGAGVITLVYPECIRKEYVKSIPEALHLSLPNDNSGQLIKVGFKKIKQHSVKNDLIVLGPGLGEGMQIRNLVKKILKEINKPIVLDASGLNGLAGEKKLNLIFKSRKSLTILTPHEGEMSHLTKLNLNVIRKNRKEIAQKFSNDWHSILVLKGYRTIVASWKNEFYRNFSGGPSLATAGTGDVLSGIIGTLVSQNIQHPFSAVSAAVYIHGLAGDMARKKFGEKSVIASDVINFLPKVLKRL